MLNSWDDGRPQVWARGALAVKCFVHLQVLLAPSVLALQVLVDICAAELEFLDMTKREKISMYALRPKT